MTAGEDMPVWWQRLKVVRARHPELNERELGRRAGLSHTAVGNVLNGNQLRPKRQTLAQIVFTLTDAPGEREAVLSAYDGQMVREAEARTASGTDPAYDMRSDTQILADAITSSVTELTDAVNRLTKAIEDQA